MTGGEAPREWGLRAQGGPAKARSGGGAHLPPSPVPALFYGLGWVGATDSWAKGAVAFAACYAIACAVAMVVRFGRSCVEAYHDNEMAKANARALLDLQEEGIPYGPELEAKLKRLAPDSRRRLDRAIVEELARRSAKG